MGKGYTTKSTKIVPHEYFYLYGMLLASILYIGSHPQKKKVHNSVGVCECSFT